MANTIDILIPDLGDFSDVEVIEVLVSVGDSVAAEDGLITVETDKASIDIPAPYDGVIASLTVSVGDTVSTGDTIGAMTTAMTTADDEPAVSAQVDDSAGDSVAAGANVAATEGIEKTQSMRPAISQQTLVVPDLGDFGEVEIIEVHIQVGDTIAVEDPLVTLETDKAAMDVPATLAGKIESIVIKVGDKVSQGSALAVIDAVAEVVSIDKNDAAAKPAAQPAQTAATAEVSSKPAAAPQSSAPASLPPINEAQFSKAHASPSVRKFARELGVNLGSVKGTGAKGRVTHDDVKGFVKTVLSGQGGGAAATLPKTPVVDFAKFGEIETKPLTRIQKISGPRLQASWINLPHVTQHDLADITDLEERRQVLKGPAKERGIGLTPLAFVMKACVAALQEYPIVNSSLSEDGNSLVMKKYCHLGFAADTPNGLMVPVIRDADQKDIYEIAQELGELSARAREGKLKAADMQGASFTISSLGGIGGTAFTPIVNAPEVAILGVSRSSMQPVWNGSEFLPRLMLPLSLSYDHRVIDGAAAVRFTTYLGQSLADVDTLLKAIP